MKNRIDKIDKRIGKFLISFKTLEFEPEIALLILRNVLVVRAEAQYDLQAIEYTGMNKNFDKVIEGLLPRHYTFEIVANEHGIRVNWK